MQENDFEKQMQQKMDELKIHPSASVWQNVEADIAKARRRRRVWILLPVLLICMLAVGYLLQQSGTDSAQVKTGTLLKNSIVKNKTQTRLSLINVKESNNDNIKKDKKIMSSIINKENSVKKNKSKSGKTTIGVNILYQKLSPANPPSVYNNNASKNNSGNKERGHEEIAVIEPAENASLIFDDTKNLIKESVFKSGLRIKAANTVTKLDSLISKVAADSLQKKLQVRNESENKKTLKTKNNNTQSTWKWGLTFSAGVSDISYSFLGSDFLGSGAAEKNLFADASSLNNSPQPGLDSLAPKKPYLIKPSLALNIGLFVTKNISKNSALTAGISYKPFSTTSQVGKKDDSANYYRLQNPVNQYKSYYHFIEFPVSYSLSLKKLKKIPLVFNAGISVSQLIESNALQFNDTSGIYYYDNTLFKKAQIGFTAGIYLSNKKNNLLIGPDIYYATTKISNKGLYKDAHFTYLGLRLKFLFQK